VLLQVNLAKLHLTEDFAESARAFTEKRSAGPFKGRRMLDPDRPDGVRLSVADARALGEATLQRIGYPADEAAIITDQLIDNALCGYRFASLPRILAIAEDEKTGKPRAPIRIIRETPVSALVDGGNNLGYVAAYRGAEIAIAKEKASGIDINVWTGLGMLLLGLGMLAWMWLRPVDVRQV